MGCRRPWEATSELLADVGLILEYAAVLGGGGQATRAAALEVQDSRCMQHVARLAQRRLPEFCELGWPALTAQVGSPSNTPPQHVSLSMPLPSLHIWIEECPMQLHTASTCVALYTLTFPHTWIKRVPRDVPTLKP